MSGAHCSLNKPLPDFWRQTNVVRCGPFFSRLVCSRAWTGQCIQVSASSLANRSLRLAVFVTLPARASFIAWIVIAFGISGSKGSALSCATFVSSSRTASDTVRPIAARTEAASALIAPSMRACTSWVAAMIICSLLSGGTTGSILATRGVPHHRRQLRNALRVGRLHRLHLADLSAKTTAQTFSLQPSAFHPRRVCLQPVFQRVIDACLPSVPGGFESGHHIGR